MTKPDFLGVKRTVYQHIRLRLRLLDARRCARTFSREAATDALQRVYVINLDRRPDRWRRVNRELDRFRDRNGHRLSSLTRRFSAVDARYMDAVPSPAILRPTYTLADQLTVDPNPLLLLDSAARAREIQMTTQEIAVALSHIGVWRLIADGDAPSALVLEDDVYMTYGFANSLERTWRSLDHSTHRHSFDLLFLAYTEVGNVNPVSPRANIRCLDGPGIWQASGYILSREGARKLLEKLPVFGPVDLWLNLQFSCLRTYSSPRPIIEQRVDEPSTNSYSVLPVLSQVGVLTRDKPLVRTPGRLPAPVIAAGDVDTGLTALSTALSMLGYTCVSDLDRLPEVEIAALLAGRRDRAFNAYVNIGSLETRHLHRIAAAYPEARFIATTVSGMPLPVPAERTLHLLPEVKDKWAALTEFLGLEYPALLYPTVPDIGRRALGGASPQLMRHRSADLAFDRSPWIIPHARRMPLRIVQKARTPAPETATARVDWAAGEHIDPKIWTLREDTFPSNLALFARENVTQSHSEARLELRVESAGVRDLTSGAIASTSTYLYGRFRAEFCPPRVSGLVVGMFLHRNGPGQEIDIEFLGKDTTKMLINVFYNPGPAGTKLEYGYRGTPTVIDLGFDASTDFHTYEIDWRPHVIRWLVDGEVVYERVAWDPTPIPDQPLQFNFNLWHSRSREFAGRLDLSDLPASARARLIEVRSNPSEVLAEENLERHGSTEGSR